MHIEEIEQRIQDMKNEYEIQENQLNELIKKMDSTGLTPNEDNHYLKLLFANMELEEKIKRLETRLRAYDLVQAWR